MTPGERFSKWINDLAVAWRGAVKNWAAGVLSWGLEVFLDVVASKSKSLLAPLIAKLEATKAVPPELQPLIDELKSPTGELAGLTAVGLTNRVAGNAVSKLLDALFMDIAYEVSRVTMRLRASDSDLIQLWQKSFISGDELEERMRIHGFDPKLTEELKHIWQVYLPTDIVYPAWLRDKTAWTDIVDDLKHLGLSDRQLALLKEMSYKMPSVQDVVTWMAHEVFEPDMIAKYGLDDEWAGLDKSLFEKIGLREEMAKNYWRAHWQHASWTQVAEMLHRGKLTADDVWDWFRLVEIPPYWRDKLIAISYNPYTRVDARRMWDMGVLDDAELKIAYTDIGYDDTHAAKMVLWTKVYVTLPQLVSRYKNGWITTQDVYDALIALGLPEERALWLYQTKFKYEAAARTTPERDLSVADILAGVRKGVITRAEGLDLLKDMGYDADEAAFKLAVGAPEDDEVKVKAARELTKADILAGLKAKTITQEEARNKLTGLRYKESDVNIILSTYNATVALAPEPLKRELSRADIIKAVARGLLMSTEAIPLLQELKYTREQAELILAAWLPPAVPEPEITPKELSKAEIFAGLKAGPLTMLDARQRLIDIGYTGDDADYLLRLYDSVLALLTKEQQRQKAQTDLVAGVKGGLVTPEQAHSMLLDLGFTAEESRFILEVSPEESPFSPMSYEEFKRQTQLYRQSQGLETEEITPGTLALRAQLAQGELEGRATVMEQQRLQIDTIRRQRRKRLITREKEIAQLLTIGVPQDYATAIADNDDTRLSPPAAAGQKG